MRAPMTLLLIGAALAGCATPDKPPEVAAVPPPAASAPAVPTAMATAANPPGVDGLYRGSSTRYQADRRDCPHPGLVTVLVQNRQFTYRWDRSTDVPGTIAPDGSLSGQEGAIALTGKLDGGEMVGDLANGACALHFTVQRRFAGT